MLLLYSVLSTQNKCCAIYVFFVFGIMRSRVAASAGRRVQKRLPSRRELSVSTGVSELLTNVFVFV